MVFRIEGYKRAESRGFNSETSIQINKSLEKVNCQIIVRDDWALKLIVK
jgi:hypothetical protein